MSTIALQTNSKVSDVDVANAAITYSVRLESELGQQLKQMITRLHPVLAIYLL
ncbi:hypothetical protein ACU8KH_02466 [Lachancea thermotolerans]